MNGVITGKDDSIFAISSVSSWLQLQRGQIVLAKGLCVNLLRMYLMKYIYINNNDMLILIQ